MTVTHDYPDLVRYPRRWCVECQSHLANEGGNDVAQLCPTCRDERQRSGR